MQLGLANRVVVVTGGATGIGKACAQVFLQQGCRVAICGRRPEKLAATKEEFSQQGYEILTCVLDVTKSQDLEDFATKVAAKYGGIDVWINNAGAYMIKSLMDMSEQEWDEIFQQNVKSIFIGSKTAAPYLIKRGGGVIFNASSFAAIIPSAGGGAYAATKAAVSSISRVLAAELAPFGIRVIAYAPGVVSTDMTAAVISANGQRLAEQSVLNRLAEPCDVANYLVFLASDAARCITGTSVEISGGKLCVQNPAYPWSQKS